MQPQSPMSPQGRHRILFLSRTKKKKAYFELLQRRAFSSFDCKVQPYFELPKSVSHKISKNDLGEILGRMDAEVFNARSRAWCLVKPLIRIILSMVVRRMYSRLFTFVSSQNPELVCLWNGQKWQDNIFHAVNKHFNIDVAYFENGVLPNSTTLDFNGINANNSVPRAPLFYEGYSDELGDLASSIQGRKYATVCAPEHSFKRPKRYILVPFQKDRDSQILENSKWIKSMSQLYETLAKALELCDSPDLHIVFRRHPSEKNQYKPLQKLASKHARICFDQQSDLKDIIKYAECVVTVNSTVGLESLMLGAKVITLGGAFYAMDSLVQTAESMNELVSSINGVSRFKPNLILLNQLLNYLEQDYVIPGDWTKPDDRHFEGIHRKVESRLS